MSVKLHGAEISTKLVVHLLQRLHQHVVMGSHRVKGLGPCVCVDRIQTLSVAGTWEITKECYQESFWAVEVNSSFYGALASMTQ